MDAFEQDVLLQYAAGHPPLCLLVLEEEARGYSVLLKFFLFLHRCHLLAQLAHLHPLRLVMLILG